MKMSIGMEEEEVDPEGSEEEGEWDPTAAET